MPVQHIQPALFTSELLFRKQSQHACSIFHRRVDQIRSGQMMVTCKKFRASHRAWREGNKGTKETEIMRNCRCRAPNERKGDGEKMVKARAAGTAGDQKEAVGDEEEEKRKGSPPTKATLIGPFPPIPLINRTDTKRGRSNSLSSLCTSRT